MLLDFTREQALAAAAKHGASDALEHSDIVHFPVCPIDLPSAEDMSFLREEMPKAIKRKNISYYPAYQRLLGVAGSAETVARVHRILSEHSQRVQTFLQAIIPQHTAQWRVGTSSFRPLQEQGRELSAHASNELVHVDAGAYGATHGGGILRFFINLNPSEDRVWASKGSFAEVFQRYGRQAGFDAALQLEPTLLNRLRTGMLKGAAHVIPAARMIDSSRYDRAMRQLHNYMKDTPEFQRSREGHTEFRFKPYSAWMVFTDRVSHACLSGQHAFVDTFVVPKNAFRLPELAPWHLFQGPAPAQESSASLAS